MVRAHAAYFGRAIEYEALCDDFDEVQAGAISPEYRPMIHLEPDGTVTFERWTKTP